MALGLSKLLTSTAAALDRRFGWDKLPRPLGVLTLVGLRTRLREKNLYDTGAGSATAAPSSGPHNTRTFDGSYTDLEQPAMGMIGARFGRNVPVDRTFPEPLPQLLEPEPAARQPRAAHARRVQAGHDRQRPRRSLAPVRGTRLVQPRQERARGAVRARAGRRRPLGRPADANRAHAQRSRAGREGRPADLRHGRLALVGRVADLRQRAAPSRPRCARTRAASSASIPTDSCRGTSRSTSTSPASPATSGSGWRCCTRSSRTSTTRSATACARSTRAGRTTSSTTGHAWSTRR